jgi:hypothetical protein
MAGQGRQNNPDGISTFKHAHTAEQSCYDNNNATVKPPVHVHATTLCAAHSAEGQIPAAVLRTLAIMNACAAATITHACSRHNGLHALCRWLQKPPDMLLDGRVCWALMPVTVHIQPYQGMHKAWFLRTSWTCVQPPCNSTASLSVVQDTRNKGVNFMQCHRNVYTVGLLGQTQVPLLV